MVPEMLKFVDRPFWVIVFGIKNSTFIRNLSAWDRSRSEKSHQAFSKYRMGKVRFEIKIFKNHWYHRNQR